MQAKAITPTSCHGFHARTPPQSRESSFCGRQDAPSAQPVLEKSILSLKEFDDDQLMAMNPTNGHHQQE